MGISLRTVLAAGAVILGTAALVPAMAQDGDVHVMTVQLPGGGVEHIQYTGNVAPQVMVVPAQAVVARPVVFADPFAMLERISAEMDQQAAMMLRQAAAIPVVVGGQMLPGLPAGASGYSFASSMTGNGVCMRSVSITFNGGSAKPHVVSSTSGNCGPAHGAQNPDAVRALVPDVRPVAPPRTIEAKAAIPADGAEMRQVAWNK